VGGGGAGGEGVRCGGLGWLEWWWRGLHGSGQAGGTTRPPWNRVAVRQRKRPDNDEAGQHDVPVRTAALVRSALQYQQPVRPLRPRRALTPTAFGSGRPRGLFALRARQAAS